MQLFGLIVVVQKERFLSKLETLLPLMNEQFYLGSSDGPGKFVRAPVVKKSAEEEANKDHLLFQVLQFYNTVFNVYPTFLSDKSNLEHVSQIGGNETFSFFSFFPLNLVDLLRNFCYVICYSYFF